MPVLALSNGGTRSIALLGIGRVIQTSRYVSLISTCVTLRKSPYFDCRDYKIFKPWFPVPLYIPGQIKDPTEGVNVEDCDVQKEEDE
jgi:hypothetical protein